MQKAKQYNTKFENFALNPTNNLKAQRSPIFVAENPYIAGRERGISSLYADESLETMNCEPKTVDK